MTSSCKDLKIRVLHNIPEGPSVNISIDGKNIILNLKYQEMATSLNISSGKHTMEITTSDSNDKLVKQRVSIKSDTVFLITGNSSTIDLWSYEETFCCVKPGYAKLKFVHSVFDAPNVDVYLNDKLVAGDVAFKGVKKMCVSLKDTQPLRPSGVVSVKGAGRDKGVLGPVPVYLSSSHTYTIFASGDLTNGLSYVFLDDNGSDCEILQKNFNTNEYMGKWYQIASYPQPFNNGFGRSVAEYTLLSDKVGVTNTAYDTNWNVIRKINGLATIPNPCNPAALRVQFPGAPESFESPPGANYLVQWTDYHTVIVGSPLRDGLYILDRNKSISRCKYKQLLSKVEKMGYKADRLVVDKGAISS
jgi:apolipoprotein D and lipocalin family protein